MTRSLMARGGTSFLGPLDGMGLLRGLIPLLALVLMGCARPANRGEVRKIDTYGISVETPVGWTGGVAGGTYEYRSPDGTGRLRVSRLEGVTSLSTLKEVQLLAGTGATASSKLLPTSPTKVGALTAERARFSGSDGRIYDIVALQTSHGVVLLQTSVTADRASADVDGTDQLFTAVRQSIRSL